jgi:hypothetical protein
LTSCIDLPECNQNDIKEIFYESSEGKCQVKYEWEQPITCDTENYSHKLPYFENKTCNDRCDLGYFKDLNSDFKRRCVPCREGEYSGEATDAYICKECPDGSYAPRLININEFDFLNSEGIKEKFFNINLCLSGIVGLCEIYDFKGWKYKKNGIIPGNNLPRGIELVLGKDINIIQEKGYFEFSYIINEIRDQEWFKVSVDNDYTEGKYILNIKILDLSSSSKSTTHNKKIELSKGKHNIKFIFTREKNLSEFTKSDSNPLRITSISIYGSDEGGAVECIKCPEVKS